MYGTDSNQFGELSLPEGPAEKKFPVVVSIHGGFWKDKYDHSDFTDLDKQLVANGLATWNIEYRRVGPSGGGYPRTFEDVTNAVNYLTTLAKDHPLDLDRVVVIGHSAGGHLALWAASRYQHQADELGQPVQINFTGVVSMAGVTDLEAMWVDQQPLPMMKDIVPNFMGALPAEAPDRYRLASPIDLVPIKTKTVLVHGTSDDKVPVELSQSYYQKAQAAGDSVQLVELPGVGHFDLIDGASPAWGAVKEAVNRLLDKE